VVTEVAAVVLLGPRFDIDCIDPPVRPDGEECLDAVGVEPPPVTAVGLEVIGVVAGGFGCPEPGLGTVTTSCAGVADPSRPLTSLLDPRHDNLPPSKPMKRCLRYAPWEQS
jgi:hypothetical protein